MQSNFTYNNSTTISVSSTGSYTIPIVTGSSGAYLSSGVNGTSWAFNSNLTSSNVLDVKGDARFDGDIYWKGKNLSETLNDINRRLAILVPDPKKLEKFEALRKAYDHYKIMEALCQEETNDDSSN